jgi:hypothetical protein
MNNSRRQFILNACAWSVGTVLARSEFQLKTPSTLLGQSAWNFLTGYGDHLASGHPRF